MRNGSSVSCNGIGGPIVLAFLGLCAQKIASFTALLVLLLLTAFCAAGQSAAFATITGRAFDPSGAIVPGATITATNLETGMKRRTETTSEGLYRFDDLQPGVYDLSLETKSFLKTDARNVKLQVGEHRDLNFSLKLAGESQSVMV